MEKLLVLLLVGCGYFASISAGEPSAPVSANGALDDAALFADAQKRLLPAGVAYAYYNFRDLVANIGKITDHLFVVARAQLSPKEKDKFDLGSKIVLAAVKQMGLAEIKTCGASSRLLATVTGEPLNSTRMFVQHGAKNSLLATMFVGENRDLAGEFAHLSANTMIAYSFNLNLGKGLQQLLADPEFAELQAQLDKLPVPLANIFDAANGNWRVIASKGDGDSEGRVVMVLEIPDKDNLIFNLLCAFGAMVPQLQIAGETISLQLPPEAAKYIQQLTLYKGENKLTLSTAKGYTEKLAKIALTDSLANTPEFKNFQQEIPLNGHAFFYMSPKLAEFIQDILREANASEETAARFNEQIVPVFAVMTREKSAELTAEVIYANQPLKFKHIDDGGKGGEKIIDEALAQVEKNGIAASAINAEIINSAVEAVFAKTAERVAGMGMGDKVAQLQTAHNIYKLSGLGKMKSWAFSEKDLGTAASPLFRSRLQFTAGEKLEGFLWKLSGEKNRPLADFAAKIPNDALLAFQGEVDLSGIYTVLKDNNVLTPEVLDAALQKFPMPLDKLTAALSGEMRVFAAADPQPKGKIPYNFFVRVADKDNFLFTFVSAALVGNEAFKISAGAVTVNPEAKTLDGVLEEFPDFIIVKREHELVAASSSAFIAAVDGVKTDNSLAASTEFKKLSLSLPEKANSLYYVSPAFGSSLLRIAALNGEDGSRDSKELQAAREGVAQFIPGIVAIGERLANGERFTVSSDKDIIYVPVFGLLSMILFAIGG